MKRPLLELWSAERLVFETKEKVRVRPQLGWELAGEPGRLPDCLLPCSAARDERSRFFWCYSLFCGLRIQLCVARCILCGTWKASHLPVLFTSFEIWQRLDLSEDEFWYSSAWRNKSKPRWVSDIFVWIWTSWNQFQFLSRPFDDTMQTPLVESRLWSLSSGFSEIGPFYTISIWFDKNEVGKLQSNFWTLAFSLTNRV